MTFSEDTAKRHTISSIVTKLVEWKIAFATKLLCNVKEGKAEKRVREIGS